MATVECAIAHVTIEVDDEIVRIAVPAYTRSWDELKLVVDTEWDSYWDVSDRAGTLGSLADFAMRLLAIASAEPRFMEDV